METSLRRYCKPSKLSLQGGMSTQPRAAAITEYALFIFPSSLDLSKQWLCKYSQDLSLPVQDLPSKIARILSDSCVSWNTKRKEREKLFWRQIAHVLHLLSPCNINCFIFPCYNINYVWVICATCTLSPTLGPQIWQNGTNCRLFLWFC